jgi:uncharacterized protein (TIGR03083 family)
VDDMLVAELHACTAKLAEITSADPGHAVPTCPEWTFKQLATHVGRGHMWVAHIVATRASEPISPRDVPGGKLPADPSDWAQWLNDSAAAVIEAVAAAGDAPVWTFVGRRPASFWTRRRAHEVAVHLADAQLATGRRVGLAPALAADGVAEWLDLLAPGNDGAAGSVQARSHELSGTGQTLHFHATDPELAGGGEWLVTRTPSGITLEPGHGKADVAVRGQAVSLLLVLTRRLPPGHPDVEVYGDKDLLKHWLEHTPF